MEGRRGASSSVLFLPRLSICLVRYIHSSIFFVPFATAPHLGNGDQGGDVRVEVTPLPSSSIVFTRVNEVRVDKRVLRGRRVGFPIEEVEERKKERKREECVMFCFLLQQEKNGEKTINTGIAVMQDGCETMIE